MNDIRYEMSQKPKATTLVSVKSVVRRVKRRNEPIYDIVSVNPVERIVGEPLSQCGHRL